MVGVRQPGAGAGAHTSDAPPGVGTTGGTPVAVATGVLVRTAVPVASGVAVRVAVDTGVGVRVAVGTGVAVRVAVGAVVPFMTTSRLPIEVAAPTATRLACVGLSALVPLSFAPFQNS